jgi:hypothetical protein
LNVYVAACSGAPAFTGKFTKAQLKMANGTAALPSYSFACDPNTGIFRIGADRLAFTTGGSTCAQFRLGSFFLNEDTNDVVGTGALTINQGAADNEILSLKSSDVSHALIGTRWGASACTETDTYASFLKKNAAGGLTIRAIMDSGISCGVFNLVAYQNENIQTTHSAGGYGIYNFIAGQHDGSNSTAAVVANGNLLTVRSYTSECAQGARFLIDEDGDLFADGSATSVYDSYCDAQLARTFDRVMACSNGSTASTIDTRWDEFVGYNEQTLIDLDLIGGPRIGVDRNERGLVNYTGMVRLHNGAIWQLHSQLNDQSEELAALKGQLKALQEGK